MICTERSFAEVDHLPLRMPTGLRLSFWDTGEPPLTVLLLRHGSKWVIRVARGPSVKQDYRSGQCPPFMYCCGFTPPHSIH